MEITRRYTRELLKNAGLSPRKRFGQNFLVNKGILNAIVESAGLSPEDVILEIGAGTGVLTHQLALSSGRVVAIELDEGLFRVLQTIFQGAPNVTLIHGDILDLDFSALMNMNPAPTQIKVIGNLPYYITTPILMKILNEPSPIPIQMVLVMMQAEVGVRIAAAPGTKDYGALSVAVAYRSEAKILKRVPSASFYPKPKVDSVLVRLNIRSKPSVDVKDEQFFFSIVRGAFQYRRKTLRNALRMACQAGGIQLSVDYLDSVLPTLDFDTGRRGETLSISEFAALADMIWPQ